MVLLGLLISVRSFYQQLLTKAVAGWRWTDRCLLRKFPVVDIF